MSGVGFKFSEEIRKITYWIYFYGALGLTIHAYGISPATTNIGGIPIAKNVDFSGVFFVVVLYLLLSLFLNGRVERKAFEKSECIRLDEKTNAVTSAKDLFVPGSEDPELQRMKNEIEADLQKLNGQIRFTGWALVFVDYWLPISFGAVVCVTLARPALKFFVALLPHLCKT
jgi:hypothetical protein